MNSSSGSRAKSSAASHSFKTTRRLRFTCQIVSLKESESQSRREREQGRGTKRVGGAAMFQCTNVLACTAWLTDYSPAPHQFRIRLILILILLLRHPLLLALFFFFCCLCVPHLRNGRDCRVPLSAACMFFCNGGAPKHQTIVRCPPLPPLLYSFSSTDPTSLHTHI